MKENSTMVDARSHLMGARHFFIGYVLFEVPASLIAARCNAMHWWRVSCFSWGLVCILMTTMTTELEFYVYRFYLVYVEGFFISCNLFITHSKLVLAKGASEGNLPLMLTSLLFSNIIGGPLAVFYWIQRSLVYMVGVHSLSLKLFLL